MSEIRETGPKPPEAGRGTAVHDSERATNAAAAGAGGFPTSFTPAQSPAVNIELKCRDGYSIDENLLQSIPRFDKTAGNSTRAYVVIDPSTKKFRFETGVSGRKNRANINEFNQAIMSIAQEVSLSSEQKQNLTTLFEGVNKQVETRWKEKHFWRSLFPGGPIDKTQYQVTEEALDENIEKRATGRYLPSNMAPQLVSGQVNYQESLTRFSEALKKDSKLFKADPSLEDLKTEFNLQLRPILNALENGRTLVDQSNKDILAALKQIARHLDTPETNSIVDIRRIVNTELERISTARNPPGRQPDVRRRVGS